MHAASVTRYLAPTAFNQPSANLPDAGSYTLHSLNRIQNSPLPFPRVRELFVLTYPSPIIQHRLLFASLLVPR